MAKIFSVHSFRGGTGKSNTSANMAAMLAAKGKRVGVVDTDILSPGIHILFKLDEASTKLTLNDYLWGKCNIEEVAYDMTDKLDAKVPGKIFLIPSSVKPGDIARILREGYDVGLLNDGYQRLIEKLKLDVLVIDTHPGLNEETLLSIAISDALVIVLRPDQQDYQGTGVTVDVARKLNVPVLLMVVNKVPSVFNLAEVRKRVQDTYRSEVAAVLPHSDEMMVLASAGVFVLRYPDHPVTKEITNLVNRLMMV
jgi:MinD-like ATPase involved in chromosome partitioning or flagellar assembly